MAGDNEVSCDVEATRAAYRAFAPAVCDCAGCRNYRRTRGDLFRGPVWDFLTQFGIDAGKEAEVHSMGPAQPGGEFIHYGSSKIGLAPESFLGHPLVQIELEFKLPWVLAEVWQP